MNSDIEIKQLLEKPTDNNCKKLENNKYLCTSTNKTFLRTGQDHVNRCFGANVPQNIIKDKQINRIGGCSIFAENANISNKCYVHEINATF